MFHKDRYSANLNRKVISHSNLRRDWGRSYDHLAEVLVVEGQHPLVLGVQLDLDHGKGVAGGEVALGVPHGP